MCTRIRLIRRERPQRGAATSPSNDSTKLKAKSRKADLLQQLGQSLVLPKYVKQAEELITAGLLHEYIHLLLC